jgi:hypothetical protein
LRTFAAPKIASLRIPLKNSNKNKNKTGKTEIGVLRRTQGGFI